MSFTLKDCALISRMAGIDNAFNLRELRERLLNCPVECLFHHFCETAIRPTFDDPEFRNDFAVWAARDLQDRVLAERLGIINPYDYADFEELRQLVIEIIDERLSQVPYIPWAKLGNDFRFMRAVTVIFDTGRKLDSPEDLVSAMPEFSLGSIYYHYVEARRRTEKHTDDFTAWLTKFGKAADALIKTLAEVDFYFISLKDLQTQLVRATTPFRKESILG